MKVNAVAPGRVNLIGEHTDYNNGFVLPMAINRGINLTAASRNDNIVNVTARDLGDNASFDLSDLSPGSRRKWWDYLAGTCWALQEEGFKLSGADISFGGNIPLGAGLSSSAALEVVTAATFTKMNDITISKKDIALISQKAENDYVGVRCGIMDQFASALSSRDHALFIDCRSLQYERVPLKLEHYTFIIIDSRVKRSLSNSAYNRRREECEEALSVINQVNGLSKHSLREISTDEIIQSRNSLSENLYKRSLFVAQENNRVLQAVEALKKEDLLLFGNHMNNSHAGLRDLFEVSCEELDLIVDIAQNTEGVPGARMTGAGFGGCVVALVHNDQAEELQERIISDTVNKLTEQPRFYVTPACEGYYIKETDC